MSIRCCAPAAAWPRSAASDTGSRRSGRADGPASRRSPRRGSRSRTPAPRPASPAVPQSGAATRRRPSRACADSSSANDPVWLLEKQITSQRPLPGAARSRPGPTPLPSTGQAREPVFEDDHVVVGRRHLAGQPGRARTQRALVGRRLVGAVLAPRRDDHPLPGRPVVPQLRLVRVPRRQRPAVGDRCRGVTGQRKEQQLTAVGQLRPRRRGHV